MENLFGKWRIPSASDLLSVFFTPAQAAESSAAPVYLPPEPAPTPKRVLIDLGHGVSFPKLGYDPGAHKNGAVEYKIVEQIGEKLKAHLEAEGYEVQLSRGDESGRLGRKGQLLSRANAADAFNADMFVSIHANSNGKKSLQGAEIYFSRKDQGESRDLARALQYSMEGRKATHCLFVMLEESIHGDRPAVLIETGYLTNDGDRKKLLSSSGQDEIVGDIVSGINQYFSAREPLLALDDTPTHGLPPKPNSPAPHR